MEESKKDFGAMKVTGPAAQVIELKEKVNPLYSFTL